MFIGIFDQFDQLSFTLGIQSNYYRRKFRTGIASMVRSRKSKTKGLWWNYVWPERKLFFRLYSRKEPFSISLSSSSRWLFDHQLQKMAERGIMEQLKKRWMCMEGEWTVLGAGLEHLGIRHCSVSIRVVCPWLLAVVGALVVRIIGAECINLQKAC